MRDMQTSRIEADVSISERRRRAAPSRPTTRVRRRRTRRLGHTRYGYAKGPARFVTGIAVIVALATAAFGVEAYVRAGHEQKRITALQADLAGLKQRITADEDGAAS